MAYDPSEPTVTTDFSDPEVKKDIAYLESLALGDLIDVMYTRRAVRLEAQRKVDTAKSLEDVAKLALITKLQSINLSKASGGVATASIKTIKMPSVVSWDLFYQYIRDSGRFDLLHKRVSELAWRDTLSAGELIAGTVAIDNVKLSLTKAARG